MLREVGHIAIIMSEYKYHYYTHLFKRRDALSVLYRTNKKNITEFAYIEFGMGTHVEFGKWIMTHGKKTLPDDLLISEDEAMEILFLTKI